jgi:hypothetical protein
MVAVEHFVGIIIRCDVATTCMRPGLWIPDFSPIKGFAVNAIYHAANDRLLCQPSGSADSKPKSCLKTIAFHVYVYLKPMVFI